MVLTVKVSANYAEVICKLAKQFVLDSNIRNLVNLYM